MLCTQEMAVGEHGLRQAYFDGNAFVVFAIDKQHRDVQIGQQRKSWSHPVKRLSPKIFALEGSLWIRSIFIFSCTNRPALSVATKIRES